jgi:hypothetical protein
MNETEHSHKPHAGPNRENLHSPRPYWTRAHRDWRVWVGVVVMLAAMIIYVMSVDLTFRPHALMAPPSGAVEK